MNLTESPVADGAQNEANRDPLPFPTGLSTQGRGFHVYSCRQRVIRQFVCGILSKDRRNFSILREVVRNGGAEQRCQTEIDNNRAFDTWNRAGKSADYFSSTARQPCHGAFLKASRRRRAPRPDAMLDRSLARCIRISIQLLAALLRSAPSPSVVGPHDPGE